MKTKRLVGCLLAVGLFATGCDDDGGGGGDAAAGTSGGGIDAAAGSGGTGGGPIGGTGGSVTTDGGSDANPNPVIIQPHTAAATPAPEPPSIMGQPAPTMDPWSMAVWFQGAMAQPPLYNQFATLGLKRETGLWTAATPYLGPVAHFAFTPTKPWQGNPLPDYIVPTSYLGAFDPTNGTPWTYGWTVGIHGNKDVWDLATVGALAGKSAPAADNTCPAGTTFKGKFSAAFGPLSDDEAGLFTGAAAAGDFDVCVLAANYATAGTVKLTNDNVYELAGAPGTFIGNGQAMSPNGAATAVAVTLEIEPGTLIYGKLGSSLVITRGSKVQAVGTAQNPIVFTSEKQLSDRFDGSPATDPNSIRKQWGGIVLAGRARDSRCPQNDFVNCNTTLEALPQVFAGGNVDTDSSGTLKYVISRNGGSTMDLNQEINGLTLYSAGSGTLVDHVQIHMNSDDGIEFFGGTTSVAYVALTDNADDSFDWGHGWTGAAQFVFIRQAKDEADRAIEADNNAPPVGTPDDLPISFPLLANWTVIGPPADFTDMTNSGGGFLLRRGTKAQLWNMLVQGAAKNCVRVDGPSFTRVATPANPGADLVMRNTVLDCMKAFDIK